jgi:hypothetical protein
MGVPANSCKGAGTGAVWRLLLVPEREAVAIEVEDLDPISAAVDEEEEMTGQGVLIEALLDQSGEAVERGIFLIPLAVKIVRTGRS